MKVSRLSSDWILAEAGTVVPDPVMNLPDCIPEKQHTPDKRETCLLALTKLVHIRRANYVTR